MSEDNMDAAQLSEWLDALDNVIQFESPQQAGQLLSRLLERASARGVDLPTALNTPYVNTLVADQEPCLSDDEVALLTKLTNIFRWNAIAMVMRAGKRDADLGGHIASYGSIATLFEVGLNYFFHGRTAKQLGDIVYFQGHSSPGLYARAFLEGRLTAAQLDRFRQEAMRPGLSSYPHPRLMPDFWQFPTVSMGLGPLMSIYQARFLKYLDHRGLLPLAGRKVFTYCGDGEMAEPESMGVLSLAGRERLDNLVFVVNCNLQRLDGTIWGSGQLIQEFEAVFRGAGWRVIKVIWGSGWDRLFAADKTGVLAKRMGGLVDGEFQNYAAKPVAYFREHFFSVNPELKAMADALSDDELRALQDGGHDVRKVYAAFKAATEHKGQPTVILAKTVKGYGMGSDGEGLNVAHQTKKMTASALEHFRDRFGLQLTAKQLEKIDYYKPAKNSPEMRYLKAQRERLGGFVPERVSGKVSLPIPELEAFKALLVDSGERHFSTTMAFVRLLSVLLKDKSLKSHVVPIVADESRTFGMEGLFRQIGIYSSHGQQYTPEDREQLMYYREDEQGQLMQDGICEAGGMSTWLAAATSYATNNLPMMPFYIYYSMFGYQRFGDLVWAAADMQARGFILGGTAGRTTLAGEGLQHQDGHNILMFSMVPCARCYDPCFAYELAVIMQDGLRRMYQDQENIFYYVTLMNENYAHPALAVGEEENIIKGLYRLQQDKQPTANAHVQLIGAGTILCEVIKAAKILRQDFAITSDVWSATSFCELKREAMHLERYHRLHPGAPKQQTHVERCLANASGPVIAATDYIRLYAEQICDQIKQPYHVLGTDGFGRSDGRGPLREFFEVNANMIAYSALYALHEQGHLDKESLVQAAKKLAIGIDREDPWTV